MTSGEQGTGRGQLIQHSTKQELSETECDGKLAGPVPRWAIQMVMLGVMPEEVMQGVHAAGAMQGGGQAG
jgi:hypothetical protein